MNFERLFDMQEKLDQNILENKTGTTDDERFEKLTLALMVELAECANEWRGFKFWSKDQDARRSDMLEEYVDCLHFLLSIGNHLSKTSRPLRTNAGVKHKRVVKCDNESPSIRITAQFNALYRRVVKIRERGAAYIETFQLFNALGEMLGFTDEDIQRAYDEKNKVNFERQQNGY